MHDAGFREKRRRFCRWRVTRIRYEGSSLGKHGISFRFSISSVCLLYPMISISLFRSFNALRSKCHAGASISGRRASRRIYMSGTFVFVRSIPSGTRERATFACQIINISWSRRWEWRRKVIKSLATRNGITR